MRRLFDVVFVAALALPPMAVLAQDAEPAADPQAPAVEPVAVSVVAPDLRERLGQISPLTGDAGTSLHLLVQSPGTPIVAVDTDASTLEHLTDDRGTDLTRRPESQEGSFFAGGPFGAFPTIADDGSAAVVEISGPSTPAPEAERLVTEGTLVLRVAAGVDTVTLEGVDLAPAKLEIEGHDIEIREVGPPQWGDAPLAVQLVIRGEQTLQRLAEVRILNPAGETVSHRNMTSTGGQQANWSYELSETLEQATLELDFYTELETREVPFNVEAGLGL